MSCRASEPAAARRAVLERRYRRLLMAYPREYRTQRGDELIATLVELSSPGQRRPVRREALALLLGGLRERSGSSRYTRPAHVWLGALGLAAALYITGQLLTECLFLASGLEHGSWARRGGWNGMAAVHGASLVLAACALAALLKHRYAAAVAVLITEGALFVGVAAAYPSRVSAVWIWIVFSLLLDAGPALLLVPLLRHRIPVGPWRWQLGVPLLPTIIPGLYQEHALTFLPPGTVAPVAHLLAVVTVLICLGWGLLVDARVPIAVGLLALFWTLLTLPSSEDDVARSALRLIFAAVAVTGLLVVGHHGARRRTA